MRGRELARMLGVGLLASAIGIALVLAMDWFPEQGSTAAEDIDRLYDVLLLLSIPIFVLVMTIAIYSVVRWHARPGDKSDGVPIHGDTRLEVVWVVVPFLIVSAISVYSWLLLDDIEDPKPNTMIVNVTGQQFAWTFEYPQPGGAQPIRSNQLVLPVGQPVEFKIKAVDVIHSFWVPAFRLKIDAVPGLTTTTRLTPNRLDRYDVVCAELCGLGHSTMRQSVEVRDRAGFERFLADRRRSQARVTGEGAGPAAGDEPGGAGQSGAGSEPSDPSQSGAGPPSRSGTGPGRRE